MTDNIKTFTVVMGSGGTPAQASPPFAWLNFRLCDRGIVREAPSGRGGLIGIYMPPSSPLPPDGGIDLREVISLVHQGAMEGILLDLPADESGMAAAGRICPRLDALGIRYFIPEQLSAFAKKGIYIIPSAVSGGSLRDMLGHFCEKHGSSRLALEIVRTRHDFTMPSPDPSGRFLSRQEFTCLLERCGGESFFSDDLCCRYFTYMDEGRKPHFVMFDNEDTARLKLEEARSLGIGCAFALWSDWAPDIKAPPPK